MESYGKTFIVDCLMYAYTGGGNMIEVLTMATIIAPVTAALVQAIKTSKIVKRKFLPLISVLIGIGIGASATFLDTELMIRIWAGGISGLAATGLFELSKKV